MAFFSIINMPIHLSKSINSFVAEKTDRMEQDGHILCLILVLGTGSEMYFNLGGPSQFLC